MREREASRIALKGKGILCLQAVSRTLFKSEGAPLLKLARRWTRRRAASLPCPLPFFLATLFSFLYFSLYLLMLDALPFPLLSFPRLLSAWTLRTFHCSRSVCCRKKNTWVVHPSTMGGHFFVFHCGSADRGNCRSFFLSFTVFLFSYWMPSFCYLLPSLWDPSESFLSLWWNQQEKFVPNFILGYIDNINYDEMLSDLGNKWLKHNKLNGFFFFYCSSSLMGTPPSSHSTHSGPLTRTATAPSTSESSFVRCPSPREAASSRNSTGLSTCTTWTEMARSQGWRCWRSLR